MKKIVRNVVMLLAATVILSGCSKKASDGTAESSGQTEGKAVSSKSVEKALCENKWVLRFNYTEWDESWQIDFKEDGTAFDSISSIDDEDFF